MKVYANFRQEVEVDPKSVIEKLIDLSIGWRSWVFEKDGKYYKGYEQSAGSHSYDDETEIPKELYDYIVSLHCALKYLSANGR